MTIWGDEKGFEASSNDGGPILLKDILLRVSYNRQRGSRQTGLDTGFDDLNAMTRGLQPAELIVIAGQPAMGATTFAMNIAENAMLHDKTVLVFSLDLPAEMLAMRMLASIGRIDLFRLYEGKLDADEQERADSAVSAMQNCSLYIDDSAINLAEIRSRSRYVACKNDGIDLVIVDNLQQILCREDRYKNKKRKLSEVCRTLKSLAQKFNCPVVVLSEMEHSLEITQRRPILFDLSEMGVSERDADMIVFVYRDEVYHPDTEDKGIAEIIVAKQRNGLIGTVRMMFRGCYCRFENLPYGHYGSHRSG
ncbi:DnaB-like helicase C-terminal domain-containing protein [Halopseudomonas xiamenensis]|uniref:DnaB-like helicase C-terminal domain-containing protein n=1 Tax=Halopseudomonas xiamenensis TaxID=157792 RepID=UPI00162A0DCF|nr:DnaB-like helicase C-terminal domain-containing protein [Halopseudomonas xiamenensis]